MKKLLIIDDLAISREMLRATLCDNFEILEAEDGVIGLQILQEHPDLTVIILDLVMPRMGGMEFLQKVRSDDQYKNIAIIVNTAFGEASDEITALSIGADDFIHKPFTPELMNLRIKNVLANREMLANTESRFGLQRNILDETTTAVYVVDAVNYNLFYTNHAVDQLCNCEEENYSGKKCYEFFCKRNKPCDFCKLAIAHTEENTGEIYLPFLAKTMKIRVRMMEWLSRPAYIIYMDDITEQKRARKLADERYQRELERRSRVNLDFMAYLLINVTKGIVVEHDPHGFPVPTIAPGQPANDFVERVLPTVIDFDKRQDFAAMLSLDNLIKAYESGQNTLTIDYRRYARDEKIIMWARSTIQLMKDPQTEEITAFLYTYDINENKMMQEVIRAAVHYDYDMLAHLNLFSETYKCYAQNKPRLEELTKQEFPYQPTIEKYIQTYVVDGEKEQALDRISLDTIRTMLKENDLYEVIIKTFNNGEIRHKKLRYANFDKKYGLVLFTSVDVTAILEEEAKRHAELSQALNLSRQANVVKTDFLSAISHEMGTPMNTIKGMATIAEEDLGNDQLVRKSLQTIKESTEHLMSIVRDILDMSKLESGKMVFEQENCNLRTSMEELKSMIKPIFATKNQEFIMDQQIYHNNCYCDTKQIQRVLINLLHNAAKFTPQNGLINFKIFELPSARENFAHLRFLLQDNGIGIPAKRLEHIFEPFYRMEKAAEGKCEDSGLGLAIAKGIIDAYGGNIDIRSELGVGTTLTVDIYLKLAQTEKPETDSADSTTSRDLDLSGLKILIAEDRMVSILVARKLLERKGVVLEYAANGNEAYKKFIASKEGQYDVILMDIHMPEMGGYTATHLIRSSDHPQALNIPIIAMTSSIFEDDENKCLAAGMNGYIAKPIKIERLFKMLLQQIKQ
ncbi:MAG: response regulator [Acidaminococcaceae bacterium]